VNHNNAKLSLPEAIALIVSGEVIGMPTETVYGLAGRIDNEETLRKIFSTKQRPFFDPLIVHVYDKSQVHGLVSFWPAIYDTLAAAFWPGPLTMIAPKSEQVSGLITSGLDTVAIRCPNHPLALELLKSVGVPLAAPSANRFGKTSPTLAEHVTSEFAGQVAVLDGGPCQVGVESTVVQAQQTNTGDWQLHILRPGGVTREQLHSCLNGEVEIVRSASVASPGHLTAHYQPSNPLLLVDTTEENFKRPSHSEPVFELQLPSEPEQAARLLYAELRRLSQTPGVIVFYVEKFHKSEAWEANFDRLTRASTR
jgi:L-threonylcarbamoyladenylate synthase